MNDENRRVDFLHSGLRIELAAHQERETRQEPENHFGDPGGRRKWRFEDCGADLTLHGQVRRYGGS